jgi:hypothetical protein
MSPVYVSLGTGMLSVNTVRELRPHFLDPSGRTQMDLGPPGDFNGPFHPAARAILSAPAASSTASRAA